MAVTRKISGLGYLLFSAVLLLSCSATLNPNKFGHDDKPLSPYLEISTFKTFDKTNKLLLNLTFNIDAGSLIYQIQDRRLVARADIHLEVLNEKKQTVVLSKNYPVRIRKKLTADMAALGSYKISKKLDLPAGKYTLRVLALDKSTGETSSFTTTASVPEAKKGVPSLTNIQLFGYDPKAKGYDPLNDYNIQARFDTLRLVVQASIPENAEKPFQMISKLTRFASDTLPARSIGDPNYSKSSIRYKGVNYYQKETLQTINRKFLDQRNVTVEFKYPTLKRGNYRFEAILKKSSLGKEKRANRDFGIKSTNFPALESPREKAQTLAYLMGSEEYDHLLSIQNEDSLEKTVNQFWYNHIENRAKAKALKEQYYDRATTANKEFANFKEGWKTDQGMTFILFGNPWIIDKDLGKETWFYTYDRTDEEKTFTFERTKVESSSYPFKNYILKRNFDYNNVLYQQKRLWFSGQILDTQI
jgi:GWxTD domain-containing protein